MQSNIAHVQIFRLWKCT